MEPLKVWSTLATLLLVGGVALCVGNELHHQTKAENYGVKLADWEQQMPLEAGLVWGYYRHSCPRLERIVARKVQAYLKNDPGVAAGLLRIFFHDCFVQGCDASILLKLPEGTELDDGPNLTIRESALQLIDDIKAKLECCCPGVVSCADIVVLATKIAVMKVGGPSFNVPLGRRDSLWFSSSTSDLPSPIASFNEQISVFKKKGLNVYDLVALSGAHTLGLAWCTVFIFRLYPSVDPKLDPNYAAYLKDAICPTNTSYNLTALDFYSPNRFDNQYFKNLPTGGALLCSDQNLDQDSTAWSLVNQYACNQRKFFNQFRKSYVRMSQIQILSRGSGEIRQVCCYTNSALGNSSAGLERLRQQKLSCKRKDETDSDDDDDDEEAEIEELVPSMDSTAKEGERLVMPRRAADGQRDAVFES